MVYNFDICGEYSETIKKVDVEAPDISSAFLKLIVDQGIPNKTSTIYIEKNQIDEDDDDI